MTRPRPCRNHPGPFTRLAPNLTHCRRCGHSWVVHPDAPTPTGRRPLTMRQAMARSFWVTIAAGLLLWAALAIHAGAAP